jgi:signal transduction histidine kinase
MERRLSPRVLRWLAIVLSVVFWLAVLLVRTIAFSETRSLAGDFFALLAIGLGAFLFSTWVFGLIDQREVEIHRRSEQLTALHEAALALTTELELGTVLQKVVDLSRNLVNAKYGALGVLDEAGQYIEQFITSGITPEQRAVLGDPPRGHGLLGALIKDGVPIRVPEISRESRAVGFPPNHPPMHSLLGVPIKSKGRVFGDLYMTDKIPDVSDDQDYTIFSERDQRVLEMFATQAAIAIENAQLYRQTQQLAILQERERFGMDLHDGIIQSIYAIGLMLEDSEQRIEPEPQEAKSEITRALHGLNDVIRDIRNYILELRPERFQGRDLKHGLEELARELRANTFLNLHLHTDATDASALAPERTVEILHIAQEALTNVRKHGRATRVEVSVQRAGQDLLMIIEDNGVGIKPNQAERASGQGMSNMRERARSLGGALRVEPREGGGTRVMLRVPMDEM